MVEQILGAGVDPTDEQKETPSSFTSRAMRSCSTTRGVRDTITFCS